MNVQSFIQDLAVVMIVAGLVTVLFHRFKQPVVLGYLLAGMIIGPNTPPFSLIQNEEIIHTLAELGVLFLMFSLGLHFSLRKLKQVGPTAFVAASLEILFMIWIGYTVGRLSGWSKMDSIFLGAILSISSTTIIIKALNELGRANEKFSELIFGILVVEDILAIGMIALLSSIAETGTLHPGELFTTLGKLGIFLTTILVIGLIAVPPLLRYVSRFKSNEMLLITVLGLCFGVALLAIKLGYSIALGAFLIGAVIAETKELTTIENLVEPIRDLFSAVFFVAIGMLIEPAMIRQYAVPIAVITLAVVAGKVLTCSFGTFVAGHDMRTSLRVGMGLAQIGEFSFIIASLGLNLKVTSEFLYPIAVAVSATTTLLTPYLIRSSDKVVACFDRLAPRSLVNWLDLYGRWAHGLVHSGNQENRFARKLIRKLIFQMALNLILVTAIFLVAIYIAETTNLFSEYLPSWLKDRDPFVWLGAVLFSLPILITIFRKLEVLGMLVAEINVPETHGKHHMSAIRRVITDTVFGAGLLGVSLWILLISSTLLPDWPTLIALVLIAAGVAAFFWRSLVQIYAQGQNALREALSDSDSTLPQAPETSSHHVFSGTEVETIVLPTSFWASGQLLGQIHLRAKTGANAIGIERDGKSILNPGADEILQAGDKVALLGTRQQLKSAREYFTKG